jgi:RNA polymerase sigma factor (sigma-70 family)
MGVVAQPAALPGSRRRLLPAPALGLLTDERLARLAGGGDRAAFAAVFQRYHQPLYRYCLSILRNKEDASDALQSTMLRALHALEGDTREIALRPWLYRIAFNESITLLRRRSANIADSGPAAARNVEESAAVRARLDELLADMRELPERQRGALAMRELGGLDYSEIGAALETTPAGAKQAIYEARRALHEMAKGRDMHCDSVRNAVSDGDGRALRGRAVRAHLRDCPDCESFRTAIAERRTALGALSPALPAAASARLFENVMAAAGGGSVAGASLYTGVGVPVALKSVTAVAMAVTVGVGVMEVAQIGQPGFAHHHNGAAAPAAPAALPSSVPASTTPSQTRHERHGRHGRHGTGRTGAHHSSAAGGAHAKARVQRDGRPARDRPRDTAERPVTSDTIDPPNEAPSSVGTPPQRSSPIRQVVRPGRGDGPVAQTVATVRHNTAGVVRDVTDTLPQVPLPHVGIPSRKQRAT